MILDMLVGYCLWKYLVLQSGLGKGGGSFLPSIPELLKLEDQLMSTLGKGNLDNWDSACFSSPPSSFPCFFNSSTVKSEGFT